MKNRITYALCILMAVLIVVIGMTTVSFSWFKPASKSGVGLSFSSSDPIRSEDCIINTVVISDGSETSQTSVSVPANGRQSFITTITHGEDSEFDTNVSLYISSIGAEGADYCVGVVLPTNTYRDFTGAVTDLHIIRNANIPAESKVSNGELKVEWFVDNKGESALNIDTTKLYITYN